MNDDRKGDSVEAVTLAVGRGAPQGEFAGLDMTPPRYVRSGTLGEGGMGEVTLCTDRRIGSEVAHKVMRIQALADGELRARFLREALVQGQLEHPSIVPVYDVGCDDAGSLYFTMKRVRGTTLDDILGRLRAKDAEAERAYSRHKLLTAFNQVCLAVDFAHARGVVHRDLKPGNIMLGDFGEVYVLDWGLAKVESEPMSSARPEVNTTPMPGRGKAVTETGAVLGTPGYMAPEQIEADEIDGRADVYALGSVLFEILTFLPLHEEKSIPALCAATLRGAEARPSVRAPMRDVPPELEAICVRATARTPAERYASARDLESELARFLEGDRDYERRRELSRDHTEQASRSATLALGEGDAASAARTDALRELGRALVLDPENTPAADRLVELLTLEPRELPKEVAERIDLENVDRLRLRARVGALGYLLWFPFVPVLLWAGIRSAFMFVLTSLAWLGGAIVLWLLAKRPTRDGSVPWYVQVALAIAPACASSVLGPLVLLPTIAVAIAYTVALGTTRGQARWHAPFIAVLVILVPVALELWGMVPPSYDVAGRAFVVLPRLSSLPPPATYWCLFAASLGVIVVSARMGNEFSARLQQAERSMHLYAWQIRQLVPHISPAPGSAPRL